MEQFERAENDERDCLSESISGQKKKESISRDLVSPQGTPQRPSPNPDTAQTVLGRRRTEMSDQTNNKNMKLPPHLRQWVVQQMVAIDLQVLSAELANKFLDFLKEREESGFAEELTSCLSEAQAIIERVEGRS